MKPKISLVTLGVSDLETSIKFYKDVLKLPMRERTEGADIAFFMLEGTWLSIYPRIKLADDATVKPEGDGFTGFALAHCVKSEKEVDEILALVNKAGAKIIKPAQKTEWGGYSGYFTDPDNFLWEIAYNPFFDLT
jgi:catechol 2,3-dioxygenase-like lactoylglutathione lyase family enzyme